jgi:hypothetical protein
MNAARRKIIEEIEARIVGLIAEIDAVMEEEQSAFDNLPESLQEAERGQAMSEAIDSLQSARDDLENVNVTLETARA